MSVRSLQDCNKIHLSAKVDQVIESDISEQALNKELNNNNHEADRSNHTELTAMNIQIDNVVDDIQLLNFAIFDSPGNFQQAGPTRLKATSTQTRSVSPQDIRPLRRAGPRSKKKKL